MRGLGASATCSSPRLYFFLIACVLVFFFVVHSYSPGYTLVPQLSGSTASVKDEVVLPGHDEAATHTTAAPITVTVTEMATTTFSEVVPPVVMTVTETATTSPSLATPAISEVILPEIQHYTSTFNDSAAKHLMLLLTRGEQSFGQINGRSRSIDDYVKMLRDSSGLQISEMSLAVMTSDWIQYARLINETAHYGFAKVQILHYHPKVPLGYVSQEPADRHADSWQHQRRHDIAIARNVLMLRALDKEENIFWYDADVVKSDKGILAKMLEHAAKSTLPGIWENGHTLSSRNLPPGLIHARAEINGGGDYDLNAFAFDEDKPDTGRTGVTPGERPHDVFHMWDLTQWSDNESLFWLDAVGATLLWIRADLVREGLIFPWFAAVGTKWEYPEGWGGLETMGICYIGYTLGWGCYGLGGSWKITHEGSTHVPEGDEEGA